MDTALFYADTYFFTPYVYPSFVREDHIQRQVTSLYLLALLTGLLLYFITGAVNYYFFFDHHVMQHRLFGKNQLRREIEHSCSAIAVLSFLSLPFLLLIVNGHCNLLRENYDTALLGKLSVVPEVTCCMLFVDLFSYVAHRLAHHKYFYKYIHKQHHMYKVTTPFASHAFHPLDGLMQVLPYYLCAIFFPIQKHVFIGLLVFGNVWAVFIHDGEIELPKWAEWYINGARHHANHHLSSYYNYGQFLTVWDRMFDSFKDPSSRDAAETDVDKEWTEEIEFKAKNEGKSIELQKSRPKRKEHSLTNLHQCDWAKVRIKEQIMKNICDDVFIEGKYTADEVPTFNIVTKELYSHFYQKQRRISCCSPQYYSQTSPIKLRQRANSSRP